MIYRVRFLTPASNDIQEICAYLGAHSPGYAATWVERLESAVDSLRRMPQRWPVAPDPQAYPMEVRQVLFDSYRVLFTVAGDEVRILRVRHTAQDARAPEDES